MACKLTRCSLKMVAVKVVVVVVISVVVGGRFWFEMVAFRLVLSSAKNI